MAGVETGHICSIGRRDQFAAGVEGPRVVRAGKALFAALAIEQARSTVGTEIVKSVYGLIILTYHDQAFAGHLANDEVTAVAQFLDMAGEEISRPSGNDLGGISRVDMAEFEPRLADITVEALCDVDNPLLGKSGAARIYAPQKGASKEVVERLETGMQHFVTLLSVDLGFKHAHAEGMGAGGGMAAGLSAFLNASLRKGIDMVMEQLNIAEALDAADLVITTEGRLDSQTLLHGKAPAGIASEARAVNVPCIAIAGEVETGDDSRYQDIFTSVFSLCPGPVSRDDAMQNAAAYLQHATRQAVSLFLAGKRGNLK